MRHAEGKRDRVWKGEGEVLRRQEFRVTDTIWCICQPSYLNRSNAVKTSEGIRLVDAGRDSTGTDIQA